LKGSGQLSDRFHHLEFSKWDMLSQKTNLQFESHQHFHRHLHIEFKRPRSLHDEGAKPSI